MNTNRIDQRASCTTQRPITATSSDSCSKLLLYASGFARIRRSTPAMFGKSPVRTISRRRRLTRFRSTIFRRCFGTTIPTLGCDNREVDARASRRSVCILFPVRLTASRSVSLVSLDLRGKPNDLGAGVFRRQLNGEPFTSFLAAPAKNFTPPFSSHPQPEPVGTDAALVAGTIGGLTHYFYSRIRENGAVRSV
jgi:hypothetical protein